jgi:hypothetical protein
MHIDGTCHCGSISFSADVDPAHAIICHCSDCQILSGSAFRMSVMAPIESLKVDGEPKRYIKTADSGAKRAQLFCAECGTPLFTMAAQNPTSVTIRLGCVTQRAQLMPVAQIWRRSSMPWLAQLNEIPGSPEQQAKPTL